MKRMNFTALVRAAIGTIWFVVLASIGAEIYAPLKNLFVQVGGHHWTGKSILSVVVFALCYLIHLNIRETRKPDKWTEATSWSAIAGGAAIFAYFLWHFFQG